MDAILQDMLRIRDMHSTASGSNGWYPAIPEPTIQALTLYTMSADTNALDTASATRSTADLEAITEHEYALGHQTDNISEALVALPRGNGEIAKSPTYRLDMYYSSGIHWMMLTWTTATQ
ncbi:hypothetical protein GSI_13699 [Ganoderma sinense ZZ0214-1]|uniref:Uncharacterized protein n=1 Tax=Ganoderma sinense ZZ0214-1 TaxID=1077348 RepID=A0A2G8RRI1_9APHY|nr:hypothetical protein GSI_13699 [Ganoderma sinense ZZ0214-1]